MATRILLIRHGSVDTIGNWISGRRAGVHLNQTGKAEAAALAQRLAGASLAAIYSSPLERTRETAEPLARSQKLDVNIREEFSEIDFGEWTGKAFSELAAIPLWRQFNAERSAVCIPGGECMPEVAQRMARGLESIEKAHQNEAVAVFSHADPIRSVICHYAGTSLDKMQTFEIDPASISTIEFGPGGVRIRGINSRCGVHAAQSAK